MSGGNGNHEIKPLEQPQTLEMRIVAEVGKPLVIHFPGLPDKLMTYGFLKMAEKTIDAHYKSMDSKIVQPEGAMVDFARRFKS